MFFLGLAIAQSFLDLGTSNRLGGPTPGQRRCRARGNRRGRKHPVAAGDTLASRGQAGAAEDPEEVRFADVEPCALEGGVDVCPGGPLAAEFAGPLAAGITFRGCLAAGPGGGEERVDVGVACEVADDRTNGTDMELKPLGDFGGGYRFVELGTAASLLMGTRARRRRPSKPWKKPA